MNKLFTRVVFLFMIFALIKTVYGEVDYVEGELIVKYKKGLSERSKDMINKQAGGTQVKSFGRFDAELIELPLGMGIKKAAKRYKFYPKVEIAEPNYYIRATATTPNDTNFSKLWGLNNTGQTVNGASGTNDADMDAPEAWDTTTGSSDVVVAVIDTGIDIDHEDLSGNLWTNSSETAGDSIDNDSNGYVDDVIGWDFVNDDNDPDDDNDHGSFVGGIIGAIGNNNKGVCGVSWTVKIMPLKILGSNGIGTTANAISAINYAADKNIKVINASWSSISFSNPLKSAIEDSNALFITAAGNDGDGDQSAGWDIDIAGQEIYPASYNSSNVLAVASIDQDDAFLDFSNYGTTSVDVAAPGKDIYSSNKDDAYGFSDGTSASCAYASGLAGLVLAAKSTLTTDEVKSQIINTVDIKSNLTGKVASGGRINANSAITAPAVPISFSASTASSTQVNLSWTDTSTNELGFRVERKTGSGSYSEIATPAKNSTSQSDTGLTASTTYTYRIRAYNSMANSSYSSEATATTSSADSGTGGGSGGGGGGCFIATAAFGTPMAREVQILCDYRDVYLMNSCVGREIVRSYYTLSPYIAKRIEHDRYLKVLFRFILKCIVGFIKLL